MTRPVDALPRKLDPRGFLEQRILGREVVRVGTGLPCFCFPEDVQQQVYEETRVYMAKFDAADLQASGEPVPEEIQRLLGNLIASATSWTSKRQQACPSRPSMT